MRSTTSSTSAIVPSGNPSPDDVRAHFREPVPRGPSALAEVHGRFLNDILPYATGNTHPGFMGWVHGGGTPVGMLAEMLAASLNANLGGRDHIPIEVERQIVRWMQTIFGFPESATGLFVTGTSMANSHRRADRPRCGPGIRSALRGRRREFPQVDCVRFGGRSHLRCAGDGFLRDRQRCSSSDSGASRPRDGSGGTRKGDRRRIAAPDLRRSCWWARPEPWIPAPLTISARWPIFRAASVSGFMSTELAGRSPYWRPIWLPVCAESSARIRSRSTFTNGARSPMTRASSWCATACCTARLSPPPPLTCAARSGDWRAAHRGRATLGPISPAAFAL